MIIELGLAFGMLAGKSYMSPSPRIIVSQAGNYALQFTPPKFDPSPRKRHDSLLCLYRLNMDGHEEILWKSHLDYVPSRFVISMDGHVAAISTYPEEGDGHAVVLFDDRGKVIGDYTSQDLLTKDELAATPIDIWGGRKWITGANFDSVRQMDDAPKVGPQPTVRDVGEAKGIRNDLPYTLIVNAISGRRMYFDLVTGKPATP